MRVMRSSRKFLPQLNLSTNKSQSVCCSGGRGVNTAPSCSKTVSVSMQQASAAARLLSSAGINLWLTTGIPAPAMAKCWLGMIRAAPAPRRWKGEKLPGAFHTQEKPRKAGETSPIGEFGGGGRSQTMQTANRPTLACTLTLLTLFIHQQLPVPDCSSASFSMSAT